MALCINTHTHTLCIDGLIDVSSFLHIENYQRGIYFLKNGTYFTPVYILEPNLPLHVQPMNTHGVLIQTFLHIFGFESSGEKAHCLHWGQSGNPKAGRSRPSFSRDSNSDLMEGS